ncbi:MAG: hypothetical protein N3A61_00090, partial [Ignavibacteria bacterium]|nr:hypothetical protein [Ignavibacteria bacterium]
IYTFPSMQLIYDGQLEGIKFPHALQLKRLKEENKFYDIYNFYMNLFSAISNSAIKDGYFKFLLPLPAWETSLAHFNFIIYLYENEKLEKDLVVVNFSQYHSQCKVKIESYDLINNDFEIEDRLSEHSYLRSGNEMFHNGLYLDLEPYQAQIFSFKKIN